MYEVHSIDACQIDGEVLDIVCPSFLRVYVRSATYGRKAKTTHVCTGLKDPGPSQDCLDSNVLNEIRTECHSLYSCSHTVAGNLADLSATCNTIRKELNVTYTCGIASEFRLFSYY